MKTRHLLAPLFIAGYASVFACGGSTTVDGGGGSTSSGNTTSTTSSTTATGTSTGNGGPNFGACDGPGECILVAPGCCGVCGKPTLSQLDAINHNASQDHFDATCDDPSGPCPGCPTQNNPDLFAYCDPAAKQCVGDDITASKLNQCEADTDCRLRMGLGCCEACEGGVFDVTAVPQDWSPIYSLLCDEVTDCPNCAPTYPDGLSARCLNNKCAVVSESGSP